MSKKEVIVTGLRVNNDLHIGNYLGAIKPIVDMAQTSNDSQINLFVPDLHSITTNFDNTKLQKLIIDNIKTAVAFGLPIEKSNVNIYRQSYVSAHSELTWILDCFTGYGELSRMIEFKEKSAQIGSQSVGVGLFNYPVLMAADILLYDADYVPVGDDQRQHLEFTRNIATKFNSKYGDVFNIIKSTADHQEKFNRDQAPRIKDLLNPAKKMSKSSESNKGVVFLSDKPEEARHKIMSATTDSIGSINYNHDKQPGISNLFDIMAMLSNEKLADLTNQYSGSDNYMEFKKAAADIVSDFLSNFQQKLPTISDQQIIDKLQHSEAAMNEQANKKLYAVQQAIGLR